MIDREQIEQWMKEGTITKEQAQKMLADTSRYKKEQSSNKLIIAISTIGSILLGIGVVLFVASNWQLIPNIIKVFLLFGGALGSCYLGYIFAYQKQNLPRVGSSLLFLGSLLFGATVFLIAQMYHVNANSHTLMLIWLVGIIPLVYVLKSLPIASLSTLLFYIWVSLFVFRNVTFFENEGDFFALPVLYLISGILVFGIGGIHYLSNDFKNIARVYRIGGIQITMLALFLLTFRFFSGHYDGYNLRAGAEISSQFTNGLVIFSILAIVSTIINLFLNPVKTDTSRIESWISLGLVATALIFFFFPPVTNGYVVLFNLILAAIIFVLLYVGYHREDIKLVNIAMTYLAIFIIVRYFDFFWSLLPRAIFFMVGGFILVLGSIVLERERRQLKKKFGV